MSKKLIKGLLLTGLVIGGGVVFYKFVIKPNMAPDTDSGLGETQDDTHSNYVTAGKKKAKSCWCAGPHGMIKCPCGGHHLSGT